MSQFRLWNALIPLVATAALVAACGDSGRQPAGSTVPPSQDETHWEDGVPVVHVSTRWISDNASDLATLARSVDFVFVGSVVELRGERFESAIQPTPENGGPLSNEFPISLFAVRVEKPIVGGLAAGSTVTLEQEGGLSANSDGTEVRIILSGDEPLSARTRYLFFASRKVNGSLVSAPFERFLVGDGGNLASLPGWSHLPAVKRLTGISVDEATNEIAAVYR